MRRALLLSAALLGGCVLTPVDLTGKACPCPPELACDRSRNVCVEPFDAGADAGVFDAGVDAGRADASADAAALIDAGPVDGGPDASLPARVTVQNLHAAFTTPHTVRWAWDIEEGQEAEFFTYELVVGTSEDAVREMREDEVRIWTAADNPELGWFRLPRGNGADLVVATSTDDHAPSTAYHAMLRARDTGGRWSTSNVASARTSVSPTQSLPLFGDAWASGYYNPTCVTEATTAPASGTAHVEYVQRCQIDGAACVTRCDGTGGCPFCWENVRRQGLSVDTSALTEGAFSQAYLELSLSYEGPEPTFWSDVRVRVDETDYVFAPLSYENSGEYRRYQVRLSALTRAGGGGALTHADLSSAGASLPITMFWVGGGWADGSTLRVDEVSIRW